MITLSLVPRCSRVRSWIAPMLSTAHWSWRLMSSSPMPRKVRVRCSSGSKPQSSCRAVQRQVVGQRHAAQPLRAHGRLVERRVEAGEERVPVGVRVVHRHVHLRDRHRLRQRDHESGRKHRVRDAHVRAPLVDDAQRRDARQPRRHLFVADLGRRALAHHARHRPALAVDVARRWRRGTAVHTRLPPCSSCR